MKKPLTRAPEEKRERIEKRAEKEVEWFFRTMGGRVPEEGVGPPYARPAAQAIEGWLKSIPPFHRGALSLLYAPKEWPKSLTIEYGSWTSLVVRLECALHPSDGKVSNEELEQASIERLLASGLRQGPLGDLEFRAVKHVRCAIRAYAKARGNAPSVLPSAVREADEA